MDDRARCGHAQALAHDRRGRGGDRRNGRRADGPGRRTRASPRCSTGRAALGGERVWALEDCRHVSGSFERFLIARGERVVAGRDEADGRRAPRRLAGAGSPTASTRWRSPGRRCAKASTRCRRRSSTGPSSTCGCWSITASAWSASASRSTTRCSGTCTTSGPNSAAGQRAVSRQVGTADRAAARARRADDARPDRPRRAAPHPRAHARPSTRSRPRSPSSSPRSRRNCSPSPASGR